MKLYVLIVTLMLSLCSCVATKGDVQQLFNAQKQSEHNVAVLTAKLMTGQLSTAQYVNDVDVELGKPQAVVNNIGQGAGGDALALILEILGIATGTTGAGALALNKYRNSTRAAALAAVVANPPDPNTTPA